MLNFKGKKIFITGAAGFIGSHLVRRLVEKKIKPYVIVKNTTNLSRLKPFLKDIHIYTTDLSDTKSMMSVIKKINPQIVFHLAAYGVQYGSSDVEHILDTNIKGTEILIESLKLVSCEKIVNTGSCFEYDGQQQKPYNENSPSWPVSLYGISKLASNRIVAAFAQESKVPSVTIRPFGLYGTGENTQRLIPLLIQACLTNKPINLTKGEQLRDYLYVDDLVDAYIAATEFTQQSYYEEFNICSGNTISIKDLALLITKLIGKKSSLLKFGALPYRTMEMMSLVADNTKAKKLLQWKPKTDLQTGLLKIIATYESDIERSRKKRFEVYN